MTQKLGYAPASLADFLARLDERNKDQAEQNGLFASHPETKERIEKVRKAAGSAAGALVAARYTSTIKYQPTDITKIAVVTEGSAGLTGSTPEKMKRKTTKPRRKRSRRKGASAWAHSSLRAAATRKSRRRRCRRRAEPEESDRIVWQRAATTRTR